MSELAQRNFSRILLVKPSSLGDVVHALPVLQGLRRRYPEAQIDWLIAPPFAPLVASHPALNEIVPFDRRRFGRLGRSPRVAGEFARFVTDLRARRYDLVIDLQGLFRSGFLTRASGAPVRIGFRGAREGAWMFYSHRIRIDDPNMHAVDRNLKVGGLLGFVDVAPSFGLSVSDQARAQARRLLDEQSGETTEHRVVIVPGARWDTKRWRPERFVETIDRLHESQIADVVLVGSGDEVPLCNEIADACRVKPLNLAGRTGLGELAAVIERADLVLCHDSAAMHLAVALDRPLVCLVGPTNPRRTGPYQRLEDVVRLDLDCAPCYFRRLAQCPHRHRCMEDLTAETVIERVRRTLAGGVEGFVPRSSKVDK